MYNIVALLGPLPRYASDLVHVPVVGQRLMVMAHDDEGGRVHALAKVETGDESLVCRRRGKARPVLISILESFEVAQHLFNSTGDVHLE